MRTMSLSSRIPLASLLLALLATCVIVPSSHAANGGLWYWPRWIQYSAGGDQYQFRPVYYTYDQPSLGGPEWPVKTLAGTKVAYKSLKCIKEQRYENNQWVNFGTTTDFTVLQKAALQLSIESVSPSDDFKPENRVAAPSAKYNCFSYALQSTGSYSGLTNYILEEIDTFVDDDLVEAGGIGEILTCANEIEEYDHAAAIPFFNYNSKFGYLHGVYNTSLATLEGEYDDEWTCNFNVDD